MSKKLLGIVAAFVCAFGLIGGMIPRSAYAVGKEDETAAVRQPALFLESVGMTKEEDEFVLTYLFDKEVSSEGGDVAAQYRGCFTVNGTALSEIPSATLKYGEENAKSVVATLPASLGLFKEDGTDRINVLGGFICETDCVTTVRYIYELAASGAGKRIYRSDNIDDYEEVTVTSVSVPETQGSNFVIYIYMSDVITPKKYIDLQVREGHTLLGYHGDKGDKLYSDSELLLLYNYQIYGSVWETSFNHKLLFGCTSYNGLTAFPGNSGGIDMSRKNVAGGIDLYDVCQLQESVADTGIQYVNTEGALVTNSGSVQMLSVQIHVDQNWIQLVLKGDSQRDSDIGGAIYANGVATDRISFNENLGPDKKEKMAVSVCRGLLFPNGKVVKSDCTFVYDPVRKQWLADGLSSGETVEDDTISNQEGYTDDELAALRAAGKR